MEQKMKISDTCIAHLVKLIQMAFLSGTDIVDHLRMMELVYSAQTKMLEIEAEYLEHFNSSIDKMLQEIEQQNAQTEMQDSESNEQH